MLGDAAGALSVVPGVAFPRAALSAAPPGEVADPDPVAPTPGVAIAPALDPIVALASVHCAALPADAVPLVPVAPLVADEPAEALRCRQPVTVTVRLLELPLCEPGLV